MSLLGVDIGTTGCKAAAFDKEGRIVASAYRGYPLRFPQPGWIELDSGRVMRAAREAIREAASKTRVTALAIASQGEAVTPVGPDGEILHPAIVTFDARTAPWVGWWEERISRRRIYDITGMPLHGMYTASKILWLKKNRPEIFRRARRFLCFQDLLIQEMGLPPAIDATLAARTMLFDVERGGWSAELLKIAGIEEDRLARPMASGAVAGELGANDFGLARGTIIVTGGHDQPCGALGAGVVEPKVGMYATGTVECITPAFGRRKDLLGSNIACYPHVVPGLWVALTFNFTGGSLLQWYRDVFRAAERRRGRDVYEALIESAAKEPTSLLLLPHFTTSGTPHLDTESKGVIAGLRLSTTRGEILRAILEGVTFEMALNVQMLREGGAPIESFRAIGGGAKSPFWMQLKADLLGKPVSAMAVPEAVCLGAAILAGRATGAIRTLPARVERTYRPDPKRAKFYRERLALYRDLYPAMSGLLHKL